MKLEKLFQPSKIGPLEIKNRIVKVAVTTRYDFEESDRLPRFYAERAKGGKPRNPMIGISKTFPKLSTGKI